MDTMKATVEIQNCGGKPFKYVVARLVDGALWFYGSWKEKEKAQQVARMFENGIMLELDE